MPGARPSHERGTQTGVGDGMEDDDPMTEGQGSLEVGIDLRRVAEMGKPPDRSIAQLGELARSRGDHSRCGVAKRIRDDMHSAIGYHLAPPSDVIVRKRLGGTEVPLPHPDISSAPLSGPLAAYLEASFPISATEPKTETKRLSRARRIARTRSSSSMTRTSSKKRSIGALSAASASMAAG